MVKRRSQQPTDGGSEGQPTPPKPTSTSAQVEGSGVPRGLAVTVTENLGDPLTIRGGELKPKVAVGLASSNLP